MAKFYERIEPRLQAFMERQHLFFVATAPCEGRINLSPKGGDTFRVMDEHTVAWLDFTGSGAETAAHLRADGRMTVMFCSFDEESKILRLYGRARSVREGDPEWAQWLERFPRIPGTRQIVVLAVDSLQTSCGFGVPRYAYLGERGQYLRWVEKKGGEAGLRAYRAQRNKESIDGLPTGF
ncbi:MAG TPA: pyridoxamine 5'-phosphate oxidase family protein [Chromatiales bacterium]|nr:pyridoxamine 5'-phosphate oxidase family protein [Chromatiales bacterium]